MAGQEGRLTQSFSDGYVFSGVLIAFLSRNDPVVVAVVGFLIAVLFVTGQTLQVFYQIPFTMVQLIQAIIVICVASSEFFIRHRIRWSVERSIPCSISSSIGSPTYARNGPALCAGRARPDHLASAPACSTSPPKA